MGATMDTPNFTERPPHISPQWWYRATWAARQAAIAAHNRANRPADNEKPGPKAAELMERAKMSRSDRIAAVEASFEIGLTAQQIVDEMGVKPGTLLRYLERAGRRDLIPDFDRLARQERKRAA